MNNFELPANSVSEKKLTPDLRRRMGGGSSSTAVVYNNTETTDADTAYYDIIAKLVIFTNISLSSQLTSYDGVDLAADDILLVNGQTDSVENGIYINKSTGLERLDFELMPGKPVFVSHGTYKYTGWVLAIPTVTVDETQIKFIQVFPFSNRVNDAYLGYLYLYTQALFNAKPLLNNSRADNMYFTSGDVDHALDLTNTYYKMYFSNEVIEGNKIAKIIEPKATDGSLESCYSTVFVCEMPGLYDVSITADINLAFATYPADDEFSGMVGFLVYLYVRRQSETADEKYSLLANDFQFQYFHTAAGIQLDIDINPLRFCLNGYDTIVLQAGDRIHFRLVPQGFYGIYGAGGIDTNCTTCDAQGHFTVQYRNKGSQQINDVYNP